MTRGSVGGAGGGTGGGAAGPQGPDGLSAYQVWLNAGNSGTIAQYIASLKGTPGVNAKRTVAFSATPNDMLPSKKTFTLDVPWSETVFLVGSLVRAFHRAAPLDTLTGTVNAESAGNNLVVDVYSVIGSDYGATGFTDWTLTVGAYNGDKGDKGDKGDDGPIGPKGIDGTNGTNGLKGDKGNDGGIGPIGLTGPTGPAPVLSTTSSTSITSATGARTFTIPSGTAFTVGMYVRVQSQSSPSVYMTGPITAVTATSITVTADQIGTVGTATDWVITLTGVRGAVGPQGNDGAAGTNGTNGTAGTNGTNGATGPRGLPGSLALIPPLNYSIGTPGISGYSTSQPAYGRVNWAPVYVGPGGFTADAIGVQIVSAYSGATIPTMFVGLYAVDPTTNYPKTDSLLAKNTNGVAAGTTGQNFIPFDSAVVLAEGWYWMAWLLSGPAVATAGTTVNQAATDIPFPLKNTVAIGNNLRALTFAAAALPTAAMTPTQFSTSGTSDQPVMMLRRSA